METALPRISLSEPPPSNWAAPTSVRSSEQVLLDRERLLAAAERIARMGSWELDVFTQRMRCSDQLYELFGVANDGDEPPLDVALAYVHREDAVRVRQIMQRAVQDGQSVECDARIVRPGGEVRHVSMHLEVVMEHGRVVRLIGVTQDVTEQSRVIAALQTSERRFQFAASATRDQLWDWDVRRNVLWMSGAVKAYGYDGEPETIEWWMERLHPDDFERIDRSFRTALSKGASTWAGEYRFQRADGTYADILDRAGIERNELGIAIRMIGSRQDISARKSAERQQEELLLKLEDANKALAEFAYVVSHDLKAPLRGIGSLADWIARDQRERLDDEGKEQLDLLRGRVKRMNEMIEGILQYSRVGRTHDEHSLLDLKHLVADTIDLLAPPPNVKVAVETDLPMVWAARTQLGQVFQNLIGNAVKFSDKAAGEVTIHATPRDTDYLFEIRDNGPGIDERYHEKIFQLFQTVGSKKSDSTGVGLSIVKKIVESKGGRIWVESKVGEGSRFYFTLPRTPGDSKAENRRT